MPWRRRVCYCSAIDGTTAMTSGSPSTVTTSSIPATSGFTAMVLAWMCLVPFFGNRIGCSGVIRGNDPPLSQVDAELFRLGVIIVETPWALLPGLLEVADLGGPGWFVWRVGGAVGPITTATPIINLPQLDIY